MIGIKASKLAQFQWATKQSQARLDNDKKNQPSLRNPMSHNDEIIPLSEVKGELKYAMQKTVRSQPKKEMERKERGER